MSAREMQALQADMNQEEADTFMRSVLSQQKRGRSMKQVASTSGGKREYDGGASTSKAKKKKSGVPLMTLFNSPYLDQEDAAYLAEMSSEPPQDEFDSNLDGTDDDNSSRNEKEEVDDSEQGGDSGNEEEAGDDGEEGEGDDDDGEEGRDSSGDDGEEAGNDDGDEESDSCGDDEEAGGDDINNDGDGDEGSDSDGEFGDLDNLSTTLSESTSGDEDDGDNRAPRRRRRRNFLLPNSDDDPDSPVESDSDDDGNTPDRYGWTRRGKRLRFKNFRGPPSGPTFDTTGMGPMDFFLKFFPLALMSQMVAWTNVGLNAAWKTSTSLAEIRAFFGITLLMGLTKCNSIADYWSTKPGLRNILISKTMTRVRFQNLSNHLACSDPNDNPDNWPRNTTAEKQQYFNYRTKYPLYAVKKIWDVVIEKCKSNFNAGRNLAMDEAMVRYKGFKGAVRKFFMPSKPIRCGFKIYALCDSATGYMLNFITHPKQKTTMYAISKTVLRPFFGLFHHVFCDKLYTTVMLAKKLLTKNTYLTGAIQANRKELPVSLSSDPKKNRRAKSIKDMKKTRRGTLYLRQNGQLTFSLWNDSNLMSILSTGHQAWRNKISDTVRRRFSIDGVAAKDRHNVPAPRQAIDYIANMGGVDRADQLRAYHTCTRKSQIWWKQLFFFLVDVCRVNAYICYKATRHNPMKHSHFIYQIADSLIGGYSEGVIQRRRRYSQRQDTNIQRVSAANAPVHQLEKLKGTKEWGKACVACKQAHRTCGGRLGKPIVSKWGCRVCDAFFCRVIKNPECFQSFHGGIDAGAADPAT